jgi:hypothetical protein
MDYSKRGCQFLRIKFSRDSSKKNFHHSFIILPSATIFFSGGAYDMVMVNGVAIPMHYLPVYHPVYLPVDDV